MDSETNDVTGFDAKKAELKQIDDTKLPPLHLAAKKNNLDQLKTLLQSSEQDVNEKDAQSGLSALHFAAIFGQLECLKYLLDFKGTNVNASSEGYVKHMSSIAFNITTLLN